MKCWFKENTTAGGVTSSRREGSRDLCMNAELILWKAQVSVGGSLGPLMLLGEIRRV